ncbi:MAG: hypothetical protein ABI823_09595 [Bryobacteraceae bacterium]
MTRRVLCIVAVCAALAGLAFADELPKAETLLDRYIEVTGGKAIYEMRKSEVSTAKLDIPAQGIHGTVIAYAAPPDKSYTVMELEGVGKIEAGVINGVAWEKSFIQGPRIREGSEKADALRDATFNAPLLWRKTYKKVETLALEPVNGEDCYKVETTPTEGATETTWFSKKSGLIVKKARIAKSPMGEIPVEFLTTDYREFGGLLMPGKVIQKAAGTEFTITLDSVRINEALGPERFEPPADVKALLDKSKAEPKP